MNYLSYYVKNALYDLIDYCYKEKVSKKTLELYKKFKLELSPTVYSSFLGDYRKKDARIRLLGVGNRGNDALIITLIHELSHHIDTINRGKSNHDNNFYKIHVELLLGSFDLNLMSYESFMQCNTTAANNKKIKKLVQKENYMHSDVEYHTSEVWAILPNAYSEKDFLKENEFKYNVLSKIWFKRCSINEFERYRAHFLINAYNNSKNKSYKTIDLISKPGSNLILGLDGSSISSKHSKQNDIPSAPKNTPKVHVTIFDKKCPICGKALAVRKGKYGKFLGCTGFPLCKYTRNI